MASMQNISTAPFTPSATTATQAVEHTPINIGATIRNFRLQRGMSQGDIEKRTGLLRCYLSRVENGHTVPSLDTLQKIAAALDVPLGHFFAEAGEQPADRELQGPALSDADLRFLGQLQRYATQLTEADRRLLLGMVRKFAATASTSIS